MQPYPYPTNKRQYQQNLLLHQTKPNNYKSNMKRTHHKSIFFLMLQIYIKSKSNKSCNFHFVENSLIPPKNCKYKTDKFNVYSDGDKLTLLNSLNCAVLPK